jgi:hypothetical protein
MSTVTCCPTGTETRDAVHDGDCPTVDTHQAGWAALTRDHIDSEPEPTTGRVIRWTPGQWFTDAGGHLWRADRGPYAMCHRSDCRLFYASWDGSPCRGKADWR